MNRLAFLAIIAATVLSACGKPAPTAVEKAERRYAMVERTGTAAEKCAEGRKLLDARLDAGDQQKYDTDKLVVDAACRLADAERLTAAPPR